MKRAKVYEFYKLGALQKLRELEIEDNQELSEFDTSWSTIFLIFMLIGEFMENPENAVLPGALEAAKEIRADSGRLVRKIRDDKKLGIGDLTFLKSKLSKFENLLEYDLKRFPTFSVERTGIFDSDDLVLNADKHLSETALKNSDPKVIEDFKAAGRCLAFDLFTACGFHAVRALEAVARIYYKQITGNDAQQSGTPLGGIANDLREIADDKYGKPSKPLPKDDPLRLIVSNLDRMNNIYRKPLAHPEMVLKTREVAKNVFDLAAVSIALIAEQIPMTVAPS
jgi:hypothetical protein